MMREDGVIFSSISHIELDNLSSLFTETYGSENKLPLITVKVGTTASYRSVNDCPVNVSEYIIEYSKNSNYKPQMLYHPSKYSEDYSHYITNLEEKAENWKLTPITEIIYQKFNCSNWKEFKKKFGNDWKKKRFHEMEKFAIENKEKIVSLNTLQKPSKEIRKIIDKSKKERGRVFEIKRENNDSIYCYNGRTLAFFAKKFHKIENEYVPAEILTNIWTDISFLGLAKEGGVSLLNGKKPEKLLERIINLSIPKESREWVLDFFCGSGTTPAVAYKMNKKFIGIEINDYFDDLILKRMKYTMFGNSGGIKLQRQDGIGGFFKYHTLEQYEDALENILEDYDEIETFVYENGIWIDTFEYNKNEIIIKDMDGREYRFNF